MSLEIRNLDLERGARLLQSGINFSVQEGEALWVQGPNGVGKSTLCEVICGFRDNLGDVLWQGSIVRDDRLDALAYIGHKNGNSTALSALDALKFYGELMNSEDRVRDALAQLGLAARADVPVHMLSAGQQKRLSLARLLLSDAKLWVLDEAPVSLDVSGVEILKSLMRSHAKKGGVIVYTSHVDLRVSSQSLMLEPMTHHKARADSFMGEEWEGVL